MVIFKGNKEETVSNYIKKVVIAVLRRKYHLQNGTTVTINFTLSSGENN